MVAGFFQNTGGWVLDAACGTGMMAEYMGETGYRGKLLMVDASRKMVDRAQRKRGDSEEIAVILADVNRLPIKSSVLEGAMCTFSLTTIRDPGRAVDEMARALSAGSSLVVLDSERPSHPAARLLYPALVPISRYFCHTHIDRDVGGILGSSERIDEPERNGFMGGMVSIYRCKKLPENGTIQVNNSI